MLNQIKEGGIVLKKTITKEKGVRVGRVIGEEVENGEENKEDEQRKEKEAQNNLFKKLKDIVDDRFRDLNPQKNKPRRRRSSSGSESD